MKLWYFVSAVLIIPADTDYKRCSNNRSDFAYGHYIGTAQPLRKFCLGSRTAKVVESQDRPQRRKNFQFTTKNFQTTFFLVIYKKVVFVHLSDLNEKISNISNIFSLKWNICLGLLADHQTHGRPQIENRWPITYLIDVHAMLLCLPVFHLLYY